MPGHWCRPVWGKRTTGRQAGLQKAPWRSFYTTALGITCICLLFRTPLLRLFGLARQRSCLMPAPILPFWQRAMCSPPGFRLLYGRRGAWITAFGSGCCLPGVNLLLDWLLIYRLHLGIAGAAWATVIAQAASFCMSVLFFTRFSCQQFRGVRADRATVGRILTLGLPTLVQMGSLSVVLVVMNGLLAASGRHSRCGGLWLCEPVGGICLGCRSPLFAWQQRLSSVAATAPDCIAGCAKRWCARCSWGWCMRWLLWQCVML